ncbi:hypothetical protein ACYJW8_14170 [Frateuria aurantia]
MLDAAELQNFYPVVVTPSHDGKFFQSYVLSLLNLSAEAQQLKMPLEVMLQRGESLITRGRNQCVANFLDNPRWTHLFWIDADIGYTPTAFFRLLLSGYDVAAGVYPLKRQDWPDEGLPSSMTLAQFEATYTRYTVNTSNTGERKNDVIDIQIQPDGFIKVREAPTGFMCIKRSVFERMITAFPDLQYVPDQIGMEDKGLHYRFFDVMVDPETRRYLSEDYGFCRLWEAIGGEIYVDAGSDLIHEGYKTYTGNFAQSLLTYAPHAVGAPGGTMLRLSGQHYLNAKAYPPPPQKA